MDYQISLNTKTLFILSTSGSKAALKRHNAALRRSNANMVYFTFDRIISPKAYANLLRSPIIRGGAVTGQGLKSGIIPFVDQVDNLAKYMGAINTIVNKNGKLYGYNTDAYGFETAINNHLKTSKLKIKKAIIYGNGGVSGVAAKVLKKIGMQVTMTGRNKKRVNLKMRELSLNKIKGPYDLVVNATPISTAPLTKAKNLLKTLQGAKMIFDHSMPEMEGKTNYLKSYCQTKKIYFVPGQTMYTPQMIKQWKLFLNGAPTKNNKFLKINEKDIVRFWKIKK